MTRVTQLYGLTRPVPFVDVRVEQDNPLFLEPSAIRFAAEAGDPWARKGDDALTSYAAELFRTIHARDWPQGRTLLQPLHEPNETRLGMTRDGVAGRGFGSAKVRETWTAICDNPACQIDLLVGRLQDIPLFVEGVGPDLLSDMSTRITFKVLADFTATMVAAYPALARAQTTRLETVWNTRTARWVQREITLPVAADKRLLLVPTSWVFPRQLMTPTSFYQVQALGRIQHTLTLPGVNRGDRPIMPTKDSLKPRFPVRPTNIDQAVEAIGDDINLVIRQTDHVRDRYEDIKFTPDEINQLIN